MERESIKYINRTIELINLGSLINIKMRLHHLKNIIEEENAVLPQANVIKSLPINKCNCERCTGIKVEGYYKDEAE